MRAAKEETRLLQGEGTLMSMSGELRQEAREAGGWLTDAVRHCCQPVRRIRTRGKEWRGDESESGDG
jgi:hypothetical protein